MALKVECGEEGKSVVYKLADLPAIPDIYHTKNYDGLHKTQATTIVIDNGSSECRAGWCGEDKPRLVFRNAMAKARVKKGEADCMCIGNDITHVEAIRSTLKNQFDKNVVANFSCQEQLLDYTFSHLGIGGEGGEGEGCVPHRVVMTEPVCNPIYSRSQMTELLLECYGVPGVAYGVDALCSAYYNHQQRDLPWQDALVLVSGHQTTHVLPVLDGRLDSTHCKRINLGGMQTVGFLQRLVQLKYPDLQTHLTLSRAKEMLQHHCYLALHYEEELKSWATPYGHNHPDYRVMQLPFNEAMMGPAVSDMGKELKDKQRRQKARQQLLRLNKKKREEKIAGLLGELSQLLELREQQGCVDPEDYQLLLEEAGHHSDEALCGMVCELEGRLEMEQEKLSALVHSLAGDMEQQPSQHQKDQPVSEDWLCSLKERRKEILEAKHQRHLKRAELGKRRSAASQKRMRIISSLGAEVPTKKGKRNKEDTFGMDDEDWNVYRAIDKHAEDSDSEKEEIELADILKVLEKHDPSYMRDSTQTRVSSTDMMAAHQLVLGVERFRAPEVIFQPPMVGVDQCGLSQTIDFVLHYYPPDIQHRLVQNVFVTGGNTLYPNFVERLEVDLRCLRPFRSSFNVWQAGDPVLDGWRGGSTWAQTADQFCFITKQDYAEKGAQCLKEHHISNTLAKL